MEPDVIPVVVKPATVKKLQGDVAVLELDIAEKQKIIDKLRVDLDDQNGRIETLEGMIVP